MGNLDEMVKRLREMQEKEMTISNNNALKTAICAMEKQVGKAPKQTIHTYCPSCHCSLVRYSDYCPECGQRLEWSEKAIENITHPETFQNAGGTE